jgi:hypothetical protein
MMHRPIVRDVQEHPHVKEARSVAKDAGSMDNATINWALKLIEERDSFANGKRR